MSSIAPFMRASVSSLDQLLESLRNLEAAKPRQELLSREADLRERRAFVAEQVRAFLGRKGGVVDEKAVESAVERYFEERLCFMPARQGMRAPFVWFWIHFRASMLACLATVTFCVLVGVGWHYLVVVPERAACLNEQQRLLQQQQSRVQLLTEQLEQFDKALAATAEALRNSGAPEAQGAGGKACAVELERLQAERAKLRVQPAAGPETALPGEPSREGNALLAKANAEMEDFRLKAVQLTQRTLRLVAEQEYLADMAEKLRLLVGELRKLAVQPQAHARLQVLEGLIDEAMGKRDQPVLRRVHSELQGMQAQLGDSYALRIVNRDGEYSRIWYNKKGNKGKDYYVIVEAVEPGGRVRAMEIQSERDHSRRIVTRWAERVDEATYEAVGRDKQDDGVIQNALFAEKAKGYLSLGYKQGPKRSGGDLEGGRLNSWPAKK